MRRSSRANASLRPSAASALADLAKHKTSGTTRNANYEVDQADDIYETVDDQTYAAIAAQKRKEAREFIAAPDVDNPDDNDAAMELEFQMEDELSVVVPERGHKRKRALAIRTPTRAAAPTKRVASSFFNSFHAAAPRDNFVKEAEDGANGVLDFGTLDADFKEHASVTRAARRRRRLAERSLGNMLFDDPPQQNSSHIQQSITHHPAPSNIINEYEAPPPAAKPDHPSQLKPDLHAQKSSLSQPSSPPVLDPSQEDSLDPEALVKATDAAIVNHKMVAKKRVEADLPFRAPLSHPHKFTSRPDDMLRIPADAPPARDNAGNIVMYLTDAFDHRAGGGQHLYLFGKVPIHHVHSGIYASACVRVQEVERVLHVLPRKTRIDRTGKAHNEPVGIMDVHAEVSAVLMENSQNAGSKLGRAQLSSNLPTAVKGDDVIRCYPFGDALAPREPTHYLKVKIPYSKTCCLHPDSTGSTFSRVFGTRTPVSEAFCLKRRLKGPAWVTLSNAKKLESNVSHAKMDFSVPGPLDVQVSSELANLDGPHLSALCLNVKTAINQKSGSHEIVMLAGVVVNKIPINSPLSDDALLPGGSSGARHFVLIRAPEGKATPPNFACVSRSDMAANRHVEVLPTEQALLNCFLDELARYDPDVLIGHDMFGFQLDVLLARMSSRRSREWSRLGRLVQRRNLSEIVKNSSGLQWFKSEAVAGRLVVDTYMHSKELLSREKDYSLLALSQNVLDKAKGRNFELVSSTDVAGVPKVFESPDLLWKLVLECSNEAQTAGRLAAHLSILPLSRQLTTISGNLWSHTLRGARAERIEYLLCHEFKLIGSQRAGASKAGDVEVKVLLPDKLGKADRAKVAESLARDQLTSDPSKTALEGGKPAILENATEAGKKASKSKGSRRKPQYSGGLVLEPRRGFYDRYVLQLDFNSLYPSIIQEFNICFTTLNLTDQRNSQADGNDNIDGPQQDFEMNRSTHDGNNVASLALPDSGILEGVLPRVLRRLVEQRRQVKKLLKDELQRTGRETLRAKQLNTRQLAIKLTANSLYGCLGFEGSRFFARPLAEMVTAQGRSTLQRTVDLARDSFNAQVIYGDTDSLFVYTGLEDINLVRKLGMELKRDVNKKYKTLEIEIDAIYRKMLLLKKKKYAALKVVDPTNPEKVEREVKGLDLVRHDWCDLSHEASEHFLTQIFQGRSSTVDDAVGNVLTYLSDLATKVKTKSGISLSKYIITRALTKKPQDYPDGSSLPHVVVANRMISEHGRHIKPGDYIKYVICSQGNNDPSGNISNRAYHPDEVVWAKGKLQIDINYYLENQVLPPILRLCDPIESIDAGRIASSLGLDSRRYERSDANESETFGLQSSAEKFSGVDVITVKCWKCGADGELTGVIFDPSGKAVKSSGLECGSCRARHHSGVLTNAVITALRSWMKKYYTRLPSSVQRLGGQASPFVELGEDGTKNTQQIVDEKWLYTQLKYAHHVVDVKGRWEEFNKDESRNIPVPATDLEAYSQLLEIVREILDDNAYRYLDMSQFLIPLGIEDLEI